MSKLNKAFFLSLISLGLGLLAVIIPLSLNSINSYLILFFELFAPLTSIFIVVYIYNNLLKLYKLKLPIYYFISDFTPYATPFSTKFNKETHFIRVIAAISLVIDFGIVITIFFILLKLGQT